MGCVYSHDDGAEDGHGPSDSQEMTASLSPRKFRVVNVDDKGLEINEGDIEITESDLILRQSDNQIIWPLRSLRRYGYDAELFSFECGRRCPTGPGIFAFKCLQAESLFNQLQEAINKCSTIYPTSMTSTAVMGIANHELTLSQQGAPLTPNSVSPVKAEIILSDVSSRRRSSASNGLVVPPSPTHPYVNAIHNYINSPIYNGSIGGDSQVPSPTPGDDAHHRPNTSCSLPSTSEFPVTPGDADFSNYVNVKTSTRDALSTDQGPPPPKSSPSPRSSSPSALLSMSAPLRMASACPVSRFPFPPASGTSSGQSKVTSLPPMTLSEVGDPVNYIQLDLDTSSTTSGGHCVITAPVTPVSKTSKSGDMIWPIPSETVQHPPMTPGTTSSNQLAVGASGQGRLPYALIDFDKTEALTTTSASGQGRQGKAGALPSATEVS